MIDLTDRDRLAQAFDQLRQRGYHAPVHYAWTVDCNSCGLGQLQHDVGDRPIPGYVFWHMQKDDYAFTGTYSPPIPERYADRDEAWFESPEGVEELDAAMLDERLHRYNMLVEPLHLHWGGDRYAIVRVLRRHGLAVCVPPSSDTCIEVRPTGR